MYLFFSVLIDVVICECTDTNAFFTDKIDTMIIYVIFCSPILSRAVIEDVWKINSRHATQRRYDMFAMPS